MITVKEWLSSYVGDFCAGDFIFSVTRSGGPSGFIILTISAHHGYVFDEESIVIDPREVDESKVVRDYYQLLITNWVVKYMSRFVELSEGEMECLFNDEKVVWGVRDYPIYLDWEE